MKLISIGSSSSGNATLIYNHDTTLLIDCGIAVKKVMEKTGSRKVDALLISHEHSDHIKSAGPYGRKTSTPIYVNDTIVEAMRDEFKGCSITSISDTSEITVGSIRIKPFSTKHDAVHALGFVLEDKDTKFCYLTDTGSISRTMREAIKDCNSYFIECDYDDELMSQYDGYDEQLKARITSNYGHLSNTQALELVESLGIDRIKTVIFGHLSSRTNNPEKLSQLIKEKFPDHSSKCYIAPFDGELEL